MSNRAIGNGQALNTPPDRALITRGDPRSAFRASAAPQAALPALSGVQPLAVRNERARKYARAAKSDRTLKIYGRAWAEFEHYAAQHKAAPLPASPELVINYLTDLTDSGASMSTIQVKRAAIVYVHRYNKLPDPGVDEDVRIVMAGIRRTIGVDQKQKDPLTLKELTRLIKVIPVSLPGKRDRALILLGYAGAFRASELTALTTADIAIGDALRVTVRKSKTDQVKAGFVKVIPLDVPETIDPVSALVDYLDQADITSGPIFRRCNRWGLTKAKLDKQSVTLIVRRYAVKIGLDPKRFTGHSLRAGFVTTAYKNRALTFEIMELTGQKSERTLQKYVRNAGQGAQNAVHAAFQK